MSDAYRGHHLIADLHDAAHLTDVAHVERCLIDAAAAAGATLLEVRLHSFGPGQGVTGMAMLAESHISIHTWPEYGSACIDLFLCGRRHDLDAALDTIVARLEARVAKRTLLTRDLGS
ncbi:adenosylmethionine decarboxylase [Sphingomonas sp. HF-S4]|uniref:Adenosylmethionine decarboxylase n=1 Tax=Sphingomonas agrestis TaxID=3080540 RepID=A0ABU3Y9E6_9SPHN|nr:adenosylmethionine decarboxylase [Sphingomonas sp. HF-S4]MDV3457793.1 adenosylmethionine decarboxylase [Sphingomonas sp. HF-S4]